MIPSNLTNYIPSSITNFINSSGRITLGCSAFCAIASLEMGCRSIIDCTKIAFGKKDEESNAKAKKDVSPNLAGFFLYGLFAANVIPKTAILGAAVLTGYSVYTAYQHDDPSQHNESLHKSKNVDNDDYYIARAIGLPIKGVITLITLLDIQNNKTWRAVGLLATATVVYKLVPSLASSVKSLVR